LETGLTRRKNNISVAIKNIADFAVSTLLFWMFGFGFMFGLSASGWIGADSFFLDFGSEGTFNSVFFIFQAVFCGTAVTILSGAIAERVRFFAYIVFSVLISGFIYPIAGHWTWHGINLSESAGWLANMGFIDFAGSTLVHSVGGWASLAVLLIIGSRHGRFDGNEQNQGFVGSNLPISALGALLLYIGWIGFNGGSELSLNSRTITIIANTLMAGAAGTIAPTVFNFWGEGIARVDSIINGVLAGLVAITAACFAVTTLSAVLIGLIGGVVMSLVAIVLERWQIDDAIGAIPVHLGAGIWGTLAVGIFGDLSVIGTGLTRGEQIGVQVLGIVVYGVWTFGLMYVLTWIINRYTPIRVTADQEKSGLNYSEHGVRDPWIELIEHMDGQAEKKNWGQRAPVEPFTTAGRVAEQYNSVLKVLNQVVTNSNAIIDRAMDGIITFSQADLAVLTVNPAAERIFGYGQREITQRPITDLLRTNQANQNQKDDVALRTFKPILQDAAQIKYPIELIGHPHDGRSAQSDT
ncbi:MAG: ammonium transporter, partial [Sphaerospermopsis sp. SIO1G2]|nr:ammonium transporter [Sphaerospermopsis sp. SIO1G2]